MEKGWYFFQTRWANVYNLVKKSYFKTNATNIIPGKHTLYNFN